jgi:hypothetical protein
VKPRTALVLPAFAMGHISIIEFVLLIVMENTAQFGQE